MKMIFHSHANQTHFHMNEITFSYERMGTKTRFEKEAKGNSEMAYSYITNTLNKLVFTQNSARFLFLSCAHSLEQNGGKRRKICAPPGGGDTPYNGLYGEAPPERGTFSGFRYIKG